MGRVTTENLVKWLSYIASLTCLVVSIIFMLAPMMPWLYFRGYLMGYYSPMDYQVWYSMTRKSAIMPHTDYVRHTAVTFVALSILLLAVSTASPFLIRRRMTLAAGAVYGVAAGLVILNGLLYGYIYRAATYDIDMFRPLFVDEFTVRTLAGVITYEGARADYTLFYRLVFETPLVQAMLVLAVASSTVSVLLLLLRSEMERLAKTLAGTGRHLVLRLINQSTPVVLASLVMLASVFTYYPSSLAIRPQPPPATLETPLYAYTCTMLTRTSRGAITYTDFETYPIPGWSVDGGIWSSISGIAGAKGNVLQGQDNDRGIGKASQYYYNTDLSGRASLWVVAKTRLASGTGWHGISMINTAGNRLYEVSINTGGYLEILSFNVISPPANRWVLHRSVAIPGYTSTAWYTIVVYYSVAGTSITIHAYLYDATGSYVTEAGETITHSNVFTPAYLGITVDGVTAYFDEFIISTVDPRNTIFNNLYASMRVEVWDNLGYLVASGTAPGATLTLLVVHDIVAGTGVDGRIVVGYPDSYLCGLLSVPTTDTVLGGDSYSLGVRELAYSLGHNKTSAVVMIYVSYSDSFTTAARFLRINTTQVLYAQLMLASYTTSTDLYADISVTGRTESTTIAIRAGAPVTTVTSTVELNVGSANYLAISGYYAASPGQTSTLELRLMLCTMPGNGACVSYPITLVLTS